MFFFWRELTSLGLGRVHEECCEYKQHATRHHQGEGDFSDRDLCGDKSSTHDSAECVENEPNGIEDMVIIVIENVPFCSPSLMVMPLNVRCIPLNTLQQADFCISLFLI